MTASAAAAVLAKITAKNQLTLPKSVTQALGPVQYFEVQTQGGQIILTPVRIQRGDAVRAKLAELALNEVDIAAALDFAVQAQDLSPATPAQPPAKKLVAKKPSPAKRRSGTSSKPAARKAAAR